MNSRIKLDSGESFVKSMNQAVKRFKSKNRKGIYTCNDPDCDRRQNNLYLVNGRWICGWCKGKLLREKNSARCYQIL